MTNTFSVEVKILVNGSYILKKYGSNTATFCLFSSFCQFNGKFSSKFYNKSLDGLLEIRTRDRWMVGADESTSHSDAPNVTYCLVICLILVASIGGQRMLKEMDREPFEVCIF